MAIKLTQQKDDSWFRLKQGKRPRGVNVKTLDNTVSIDLAINQSKGIADLKIDMRTVKLPKDMTQADFLKKVEGFINSIGPSAKIMGQ